MTKSPSLKLSSNEIRQQFIDFFLAKEHQFIRSSSVAPTDDPTLLFTNAGMNQFKPIFLDQEKPKNTRAVNSQKCIRVSGKHNDLEEVGVDDYHHTFFEMLGNWSFGNYYKKEAISWAWELLTEVWKIDKNRLWVTIFKDDDESGEIWKQVTDINPERVLKFGHKDNFWEMGDTGPCGPCTEIHYYTGENIEDQVPEGVNVEAEYREIWNLVFIQYNRDKEGSLHDLPAKHVDTGAGFERLVAVLNGKSSNYDTDLFTPIIQKIENVSKQSLEFENGVPHRVIADHLRMLSFSIADGAMPGNDGRGYVLRRVLRRACRFGRVLGMHEPFIYTLVQSLVDIMGDAYPELIEKQKHIEKVIKAEETSFGETLDRGLEMFDKTISQLKGDVISGEDAFKLYDTYGFPLDLTELLARENDLTVNIDQFNSCMQDQRDRARSAGKFKNEDNSEKWIVVNDNKNSQFIGYESESTESEICKYRFNEDVVEVVLDKTPFYAESGGQIGDEGVLKADGFKMDILNTVKINNSICHIGKINSGDVAKLSHVQAEIDTNKRQAIRLNHTATHLLHKALKIVLGDHVHQAGSLVTDEKLRFDLTHFEKITSEQLIDIENMVNDLIRQNIEIKTSIQDYEEARKNGAEALFGEKYEDKVRVVDISGFSRELCGGTHASRTGDIGLFTITSESSLASGIRRIEGVTGLFAEKQKTTQSKLLASLQNQVKCNSKDLLQRVIELQNENKKLTKDLKELKKEGQGSVIKSMLSSAQKYENVSLIVQQVDEIDDLKIFGDEFRNSISKKGVILIGTIQNNKPMVMCAVTDDLTSKVKAGNIVREVGMFMGGGGGGKPHLATAGGKDVSKLSEALENGLQLIKSQLK